MSPLAMVDEPVWPEGTEKEPQGQRKLTIIRRGPSQVGLGWIRFLLGDAAGEVVDDPERTSALPSHSMVVTDEPHRLGPEQLAKARRLGTIGLLHTGDRRYRARLGTYRDFAFVWRTYLHSGLVGLPIRQLPLGPTLRDPVTAEPMPQAALPPAKRRHIWAYVQGEEGTVGSMSRALQTIPGGVVVPAGGDGAPDRPPQEEALAQAIFAPCPMADGQIESHLLYDALELGAIPIVERRLWLNYFHRLFGDHPLLAVRHWGDAVKQMRQLLDEPAMLAQRQQQVVAWWTATKHALAASLRPDVEAALRSQGTIGEADLLEAPPPRWRGHLEALRHHNRESFKNRRSA